MWTVQEVIEWAAEDLSKRGSDTARLDSELLLARALGLDRVQLILQATRPLLDDELARFKSDFRRRRTGEPMAYILGEREFFGLPIVVTPDVLIPRPDTEVLVEVALTRTEPHHLFGRLLDVCTGSGCVALAFKQQRRTWHISACDISAAALGVAIQNALRLGLAHQLSLLEGSLLEPVRGQRFHAILSNPPYIPSTELSELMVDVRDFEPHLALDGGEDGLDLLRELITQARSHLYPGGLFACELGAGQAPAVRTLFENAGYTQIEVKQDYAGHERVVSGRFTAA